MQVVTALPQRSVFPRFTPRWKLKERAVEWWAVIRSNLAPAGTCHLSAFQILYLSFGRWSLAISQRIWMFRGLNNQARYVSLCESFCIAFLAIGSINLCFEHWITGEPLAISNRPLWRAAPQMFAERTVEAQIFEDMGFPKLSSHLSSSHLKPLYPQVISSPNRFFSFPAFLTQKKLSDLSPFGPGPRRWCCGCSNVPYPTLATNCSPRNLRSSQLRNWRSSLLPAARNDPSSCWSYWKRRQTWRNSCVGKKRERRTPSRIEIDGIRFQIWGFSIFWILLGGH